MAKKKHSEKQRAAIRKDILKRLAAGESRTSIGRTLAAKYGVSTVTIRWYVKSLKPAAGEGALPPTASTRGSIQLIDIVRNVSEEGLARAVAAKRLFLQLQRKLQEGEKLRRIERQLKKSLDQTMASAQKLEQKLHKLTAR